ncbi:hypothetical protein RclHR1_11570004 [Rhizophagus clarus]|uniref:Uncharacterized protein n=1 Tax=Rhizophagus clarus TaxID=94130 RepID=A0A2Z6Q5Z5_9GLOM|nr:hypothetical protein RclHR1_11570004 [Rhizophagus clarus]
MSEQNLFVSAFQAEFLLKILARLHISKVWNTEHIGSDSISKVQNSNSKQTKVFEDGNNFFFIYFTKCLMFHFILGSELHFKADYCKSETPFQGGPLSLKLHFETDQFKSGTPFRSGLGISKIKQTFNFEGGLYSKFRKPVFLTPISKSADGFLEAISKICSFRMPPERLWLSGRIIDKISKLLNTTGLNFEDSASECNFEGPRLPERLMDRISEVCGFIVPHGRNFKDLWLSGCFLKDFEGI